MMSGKLSRSGVPLVLLALLLAATAFASPAVTVSTSSGVWQLTNVGSTTTGLPAAYSVAGGISITATSYCTVVSTACSQTSGVAGGATFDGFWAAQTTFTLPSGSSAASLTINNFYTDDRAVLYINGVAITGVTWSNATAPNTGVVYTAGVGTGPMDLTDGSQTSYAGFLAQYPSGPAPPSA